MASIFSKSTVNSRRQGKWSQHTLARQKFRDRQTERIEEEQKRQTDEYEALRKRKQDIAARQLLRGTSFYTLTLYTVLISDDRQLRSEQTLAEEAASRKSAFEKAERARLKGEL